MDPPHWQGHSPGGLGPENYGMLPHDQSVDMCPSAPAAVAGGYTAYDTEQNLLEASRYVESGHPTTWPNQTQHLEQFVDQRTLQARAALNAFSYEGEHVTGQSLADQPTALEGGFSYPRAGFDSTRSTWASASSSAQQHQTQPTPAPYTHGHTAPSYNTDNSLQSTSAMYNPSYNAGQHTSTTRVQEHVTPSRYAIDPRQPTSATRPQQYTMTSRDSLPSMPVAHATPSQYAMDSHQPTSATRPQQYTMTSRDSLPSMPVAHAMPSQYAMDSHQPTSATRPQQYTMTSRDSLPSMPFAHATPSQYAMDSHQPTSVQPNPATYLNMAGATAPEILQSLSFFNPPSSSPVPHSGGSQPPANAYQVQAIPQRYTGRTASDKSFSRGSPAHTTPALPRRKHHETEKKKEAAKAGAVRKSKKKGVVRKSASFVNIEELSHVSLDHVLDEARRLIVYRCIFEGRIFDNFDDGCDMASEAVGQIRKRHKDNLKTVDRADLDAQGFYKLYRTWTTKRGEANKSYHEPVILHHGLLAEVKRADGTMGPPPPEVVIARYQAKIADYNWICSLDEQGHRVLFGDTLFHQLLEQFCFEEYPQTAVEFIALFKGMYPSGAAAAVAGLMLSGLDHCKTGVLGHSEFSDMEHGGKTAKVLCLFQAMERHPYWGPFLYNMLYKPFCAGFRRAFPGYAVPPMPSPPIGKPYPPGYVEVEQNVIDFTVDKFGKRPMPQASASALASGLASGSASGSNL